MTTLFQLYRDGIRDALLDAADFPAEVETSTLRAFTRDEVVVVLHAGKEVVVVEAFPRVTRVRELLCSVHAGGEDREDQAEQVFEALQPIVMGFSSDGIVQIEEFGTDEPRFAGGDQARMLLTKRFRITYQTDSDSLSH